MKTPLTRDIGDEGGSNEKLPILCDCILMFFGLIDGSLIISWTSENVSSSYSAMFGYPSSSVTTIVSADWRAENNCSDPSF